MSRLTQVARPEVAVLRCVLGTVVGLVFASAALAQDAHFVFPGWSRYIPPSAYAREAMTIGDFNVDGVPDVALLFSHPVVGNRVTVLRGRSDGSLEDPVAFSAGVLAGWDRDIDMAVGDLVPDPDHLLDLVVVGGVVTILRNTGPPTYGFVVNETFSDSAAADARVVTVGDFDGDGLPDIAHKGISYAYVRFADPSGWFGEPLSLSAEGGVYGDLAADDLDGDGRCDLVVRHARGLAVFHGTPNQNFDRREDYPQSSQGSIHKVVLADFNGDGRLDIAYSASQISPMQVYVYYAREEGGFAPPQAIAVGTYTGNMAVGDVDGDGRMDLVAAPDSTDGGDVIIQEGVVLYSRGAGGFSSPVRFVSGMYQYSLGTADIDRDGRAEILVSNSNTRTGVAILRSRPRGLIATGRDYLVGKNPSALAAGDFDQDGLSDLAVLNRDDDDITVLWAVGDGSLELRGPDLHVGVSPRDIVAGYFDDDNVLDLCVTNGGSNSLTIWYGDGPSGGSFSTREFLYPTLPTSPTALVAGYLDDDNRMDVAFLAGGWVVVLRGVPGGSLDADHPEQYDTLTGGAVDIVQADLNGDGLVDLATLGSQMISVLYGLADGTFAAAQIHTLENNGATASTRIGAGDANGDGLVDLIASRWDGSWTNSEVRILYGQPGGGFGNQTRFDTGRESPGEIIVDDFDRDTLPDVAVSGYGAQHIFFGRPDGTLVHEEYAHRMSNHVAGDPMAVGDFDGDGRPDIASVRWNAPPNQYVSVMLNQSNAKIRGELAVTSVTAPTSGTTADVVSVSWMVQNQLSTPITGKCTDAVYLSRDEQWDINDIRLGTLDFLGTLAGNGASGDAYSQTLDVTLPGVFEGDWHILVRTDATDAVAEESGEIDNVMARPIAIQMPALPVCAPNEPCPGLDQTFAANRRALYYKLQAIAGEDLLVTLAPQAQQAAYELYIRYDALPTRSVFDAQYEVVDGDRTSRIPGTQAGTYYILAYADKLPMVGTGAFNIKAEYLPLTLGEWGPNRGGNTGQVTVTFTGTGFHPGVQAALILPAAGGEIQPIRLNWLDAGRFAATFDLDGRPVATCGLRLWNPGGSEIQLENAFTIEQGVEFDVSAMFLTAPTQIRPGQPAKYEVAIGNAGNTDVPYLLVDISYPAVYFDGVPAISIEVTYPRLDDPPPIEGIDWSQVSPTVELDGRVHLPILIRNFPVNRPVICFGGWGCLLQLLRDGIQFTIKHNINAPLSGYDVRIALKPMSQEDMVSKISAESEIVRRLLLADPPLTDAIAQLRRLPEAWGPLSDALAQPLIWREIYLNAAIALQLIDDPTTTVRDATNRTLFASGNAQGWQKIWEKLLSIAGGFVIGAPGLPYPGGPFVGAVVAGHSIVGDVCDTLGCSSATKQCAVYLYDCAVTNPACWPFVWAANTGIGNPSHDPNAKFGPGGWGAEGFVAENRLPYTVLFENLPAASAAALKVDITDQLSSDLDWTTLQLDEIGFGGAVVKVPEGLGHYEGRVELDGWTWDETDGWHRYEADGVTPKIPLVVDVEAGIDTDTGIIRWTIACVDKNTGFWPEDPFAGFLPPNQEAIFYPDPNSPDPNNPVMIHPGEGYLTYSVRPVAGLPTGTEITNMATIVFDWNAPIDTPTVLNTIDALPPSSAVSALPAETHRATFPVCWTGQDDPGGSGVFTYTIYVSDNGGPYGMWLTTEDTCATFADTKLNHTYRFYSVANDHVGHVETPPTDPNGTIVPDAVTALPGIVGDLNCDGVISFADINPFVLALSNQTGYEAQHPDCNWLVADINGDGVVSYADINPFVHLISGVGQPHLGDLNCDGVVSYADINPFVLAMSSQSAYEAQYPSCRFMNADINGDGAVSFADINPFVALLAGG